MMQQLRGHEKREDCLDSMYRVCMDAMNTLFSVCLGLIFPFLLVFSS